MDVVTNLREPGNYSKQAYELSMANLKGFKGSIHYVGSDDSFDYFRIEKERGFYRMARRGKTFSDHRRFEIGAEPPLSVGVGDIPYPPRY